MHQYLKSALLAACVAVTGVAFAGRDGSGNYSLPAGNPVQTGTTITSSWANTTLSDIASALTDSIAKDGQTTPTANLPMGTFKHTNVGDATARNQYAAAGQVQDFSLQTLSNVSGTNTILGSLIPAITSYEAGMVIGFTPVNTNTGAVTLSVNGLTALDVLKADGDALIAGDLVSGVPALLVLDSGGDDFILLNPQASVNGVATSDLARRSQANTFTVTQTISNSDVLLNLIESDAAADNQRWALNANIEQFQIFAVNGAGSTFTPFITVDRTGTTIDSIALSSTALTWNSNTVWSAGNDGSGSGLDADTLDGISSASFARLDSASTFTSIPSFNGGTSGSSPPFTVDSNTVVTNLNADLLDGQSASAFASASHSHAASDITSGTLAVARGGTGTTTSTGSGSVVLSASPTLTGTVSAAAITASGTITANLFSGSGASLTSLNASNLASGTVPDARISSSSVTQHMDDGYARNITGKAGTTKTLSTLAPSGGSDGDIWLRY